MNTFRIFLGSIALIALTLAMVPPALAGDGGTTNPAVYSIDADNTLAAPGDVARVAILSANGMDGASGFAAGNMETHLNDLADTGATFTEGGGSFGTCGIAS